ncbi:MAG: 50S ribosomal protein L28 [Synergistales bacterium 53_16]|jgi:large subunit ribosomal protein L28|nr:MAG: 50S ribosomal protein L28 [Synergistales bacterium 53_16]KUL04802.1 MAG: 50S ribosomal protein L28 [Synergistales bacterium 54_9]MDK2846088.1 large subunit ribosomal protein [Synergistales bacterium]MDN5335774.1 large subunit ribosomal protein [Synergistales bacterium]
MRDTILVVLMCKERYEEECHMSKICECCGRGPVTGNTVSHSNRHSRRRWLINLQTVKVDLGGNETRRMKICTRCLRSGKVKRAV